MLILLQNFQFRNQLPLFFSAEKELKKESKKTYESQAVNHTRNLPGLLDTDFYGGLPPEERRKAFPTAFLLVTALRHLYRSIVSAVLSASLAGKGG